MRPFPNCKRTVGACQAEAEAARDKLPGQYQQANDLAAQYERNRRNFNLQAEASGLNTGSGGAAVHDPYGLNSLSDAQRSTQIRGLLESLNKGDASARARALNYISANEAYFTDNELNNFASALEKGMRLAGYNL